MSDRRFVVLAVAGIVAVVAAVMSCAAVFVEPSDAPVTPTTPTTTAPGVPAGTPEVVDVTSWCNAYRLADDDQLALRYGDLSQLDDLLELARAGIDQRHVVLHVPSQRLWDVLDAANNGVPLDVAALDEVAGQLTMACVAAYDYLGAGGWDHGWTIPGEAT